MLIEDSDRMSVKCCNAVTAGWTDYMALCAPVCTVLDAPVECWTVRLQT